MPVTADFDFEPFGKGVYDRRTDAVQTAGNFIAAAAEFTAGVQNRQNDGDRGQALLFVNIDRNAAPVVAHGDNIARQNFHFNVGAIAGKRFVHGVVDNFINQVVQSLRTGRTDIHTRAFADRFKPFQNLNLRRVIGFGHRGVHLFLVVVFEGRQFDVFVFHVFSSVFVSPVPVFPFFSRLNTVTVE